MKICFVVNQIGKVFSKKNNLDLYLRCEHRSWRELCKVKSSSKPTSGTRIVSGWLHPVVGLFARATHSPTCVPQSGRLHVPLLNIYVLFVVYILLRNNTFSPIYTL